MAERSEIGATYEQVEPRFGHVIRSILSGDAKSNGVKASNTYESF